jgi:hypothetical protein
MIGVCHRQEGGESNRHLFRSQVRRIGNCFQKKPYSSIPSSLFLTLVVCHRHSLVQVKKTGRSGCEGLASPPLLPLISRIEIVSPPPPSPQRSSNTTTGGAAGGLRLNKFVRRLHDMLKAEKDSGIVEWRRGLLVLFSTDAFAKTILPKYFNTRNFKTFRRQVRLLIKFGRYYYATTSAATSTMFHPILTPSSTKLIIQTFLILVELLWLCPRSLVQHHWLVDNSSMGEQGFGKGRDR